MIDKDEADILDWWLRRKGRFAFSYGSTWRNTILSYRDREGSMYSPDSHEWTIRDRPIKSARSYVLEAKNG